jgi:hypothetical protein
VLRRAPCVAPVILDAHFVLCRREALRYSLLEVDRGTEEYGGLVEKFVAYRCYS